mmetsp:Transcript_23301/g.42053  ORF Transcript_23301/g.42053 Transcript_23301/m.42053 type:complete len:243 (-) Transcript_23301:552-1280(-)|eukprot:CAMPEP_0198286696 /NCGR_PEP_ID=MMETSP1449-20131203/5700_1 /TAXON_ID=420275 /ORGANISM="Attheya septentrionalis, Strain CCMP2084" /LENGTH=242 /DNA_ID=CAMNT_0043984481 /DNA_START=114 /DNA_END=842 /DNA_ORIENTATION=+
MKKIKEDEESHQDYDRPEQAVQPQRSMGYGESSVASLAEGSLFDRDEHSHNSPNPLSLPRVFTPATGCTNFSDFLVQSFVARLRVGIVVIKHGRSRVWGSSKKSVLTGDGRILTWHPYQDNDSTSTTVPNHKNTSSPKSSPKKKKTIYQSIHKLDLATCQEVRHAWTTDPRAPGFVGTPILRQKCHVSQAHKSFALVFPHRTLDITAVTADQCRVLTQGFSALCYRLHTSSSHRKQVSPPEI